MKLKDGMILDRSGEDYVAVATGEAGRVFNGMIRSNKTADLILRELMTEKSEDDLVRALTDRFDVDAAKAGQDIRRILDALREADLLDD